MNKCQNCKVETKNPKFCSRSCSAISTNKSNVKRKRTKKCKSCLNLILSNRTYCSDCYSVELLDMTLEKATYEKGHRSSAFALVRSRARAVVKDRVQTCRVCLYDKHVECCHIKDIGSFSPETLISVINAPENLVLLCRNCHWEFDKLNLDISQYILS